MKKMRILIVLTVIAVMILTACSNQNAVETEDLITKNPASSLVGNTEKSTVLESTTVFEESTTEKIESTTQKLTEPSTTEKASTTANQTTATTRQSTTTKPTTSKASTTTTKRVTTTKKPTTTSKPSTTKKPTTTQKQTTTEEEWNCAIDGHSCKEGQIGWVNSYDEAQSKALRYIENNGISGNFRIKQCFWCGKYTATVTVR